MTICEFVEVNLKCTLRGKRSFETFTRIGTYVNENEEQNPIFEISQFRLCDLFVL